MSWKNTASGSLKDAWSIHNDVKQIENYVRNGGTNLGRLNTAKVTNQAA